MKIEEEFPYIDEDGRRFKWRTVGGFRIKIYEKQTLAEAMRESGKFTIRKKTKENNNAIIKETPETLKNFDKHSEEWEKKHIIPNTTEEERQVLKEGISKLLKENNYAMRISEDNLEKVLEEGVFKNQFETNSSGGMVNHKLRKQISKDLFNTGKGLKNEEIGRASCRERV